jgi:hypothetical protein
MQEQKIDFWALVELFGHSKIAGRVSEQNIAGTNMLRVDVPETISQPAFTRFFGSAAIYAINPIDETTAKVMAERLQVKPIESWNISEVMKKHNEKLLLSSSEAVDEPFLE